MNSTKANKTKLSIIARFRVILIIIHIVASTHGPLISRTGTLPHDLRFHFCIRQQLCPYSSTLISVRVSPPPAHPPVFPLSLFLASSAAWRSQLFSAAPLCHLVMKRSAASKIPWRPFPLFLAAVDHSAVSNSKGQLSVDPSLAWNTLMSSARHWAQFFSGRPGSGFSPHQPSPNIIRWVGRSLVVRCTASAKRRRRLRMVVSTLSHCAFLRAFAYGMRWSVRCRRWPPMIRRRSSTRTYI